MTAPAKPTIDECIADSEADVMLFAQIPEAEKQLAIATANLDFLRAHKRITESAGRPEPVAWRWRNVNGPWTHTWDKSNIPSKLAKKIEPLYGPNLLAYADRTAADAHHYRQKSDMLSDAAFQSEERAETAERQLAELQAKHDALVNIAKSLRTELGYCDLQLKGEGYATGADTRSAMKAADDFFTAMSAVALDKGGE